MLYSHHSKPAQIQPWGSPRDAGNTVQVSKTHMHQYSAAVVDQSSVPSLETPLYLTTYIRDLAGVDEESAQLNLHLVQ